ncbi:MAG: hypothetical protein IPL40_11790 [Proteobacteria bacterium]|nr:hypothetical protein [Pseudomonadota bacterium]
MTRWPYYAGQALRAMRRSALVQLAAIAAMAVTMLLIGLAVLGSHNVDRLTRRWGRGTQLIAFLRPAAAAPAVDALVALLASRPDVKLVQRITPALAYQRLRQVLGPRSNLLAGVETDFFPSSLELRLREGLGPALLPLLALLEASPAVERVEHLGHWAARLGQLAQLLRGLALLVALLVGLACVYLAASTIRLGVYSRREEIEIQMLLGATRGFIRGPLLVEGALQGLTGGVLALAALYGAFRWGAPRLTALLGSLPGGAELSFFEPLTIAAGLLAAVGVGLIGSGVALGRSAEV